MLYLQTKWNADMEIHRRSKSGALASGVYNEKIVSERSYMQTANTRVVTFEMCGNDGLQARSSFAGQSGTWKTWDAPQSDFEHKLINDLCTAKGG